MEDFSMASLCL
ncbi:hypothetical protein F383_35825 [Gossypium arboreum]|uniref:Uncharacterized protein n=1 Tax=Gossypium arboreum TaxID=29729 RepID=A0A0B0Q111_GOSAR|nr:hypothetical protein F383_35825 [Gossypium arboreum]